tara:strand:- start:2893 stop:3414 length:522 start_codon:yes stop_codon:yes gene_type:complete
MRMDQIKNIIRTIPNFPKPGINFKDITTLLNNPNAFKEVIQKFYNKFAEKNVDVVVGVESRGFIFGAPLALKLNCPFVIMRKPGKLPSKTISEEYKLEYGHDHLEIHTDSIKNGDKVLIIDDLLATGGTANAAKKLVERLGGDLISFCFLIKLNGLGSENKIDNSKVFYLFEY